MSRFPTHTVESAPETGRDALEALEAEVGKGAGLSGDRMIQIRRGAVDDDPRLASIVALAREATTSGGEVADTTWQAALDAGWTDTELGDAFASVAANLFTNDFNHLNDTELDVPPAPDATV
jgi:hypothetical protein